MAKGKPKGKAAKPLPLGPAGARRARARLAGQWPVKSASPNPTAVLLAPRRGLTHPSYGPSSITFSPWRLRRRTPCQVFVRIGQGLLGVVPRAAHFIEPLGRLNLELVELPLRIRSGRTHVT